jgi:hypothetical protein
MAGMAGVDVKDMTGQGKVIRHVILTIGQCFLAYKG